LAGSRAVRVYCLENAVSAAATHAKLKFVKTHPSKADAARQSRDFTTAVNTAGKPVQLLVAEGYNHFEIIETLANPYGLRGRAVLDQMRLT